MRRRSHGFAGQRSAASLGSWSTFAQPASGVLPSTVAPTIRSVWRRTQLRRGPMNGHVGRADRGRAATHQGAADPRAGLLRASRAALFGIWGEVRLWDRLLPHLAGFRTIANDPPGIRRPQRPQFAEHVVMAQLGTVVPTSSVNTVRPRARASFGGAVAQQMAFGIPAGCAALVLVSTSFGGAMPGNRGGALALHPPAQPSRTSRNGGRWPCVRRVGCRATLVRSMHISSTTLAALYRMAGLHRLYPVRPAGAIGRPPWFRLRRPSTWPGRR